VIARRNLIQFLHKYRPFSLQAIDNKFVMHNLMPHIDRRTVEFERAFNDVNGADNTSTETTGCSEEDFEGGQGHVLHLEAVTPVVKNARTALDFSTPKPSLRISNRPPRERLVHSSAEGATAPETLRHMNRVGVNYTLESRGLNKPLTEGESWRVSE
jgi:hypothetical protein